MFDLKKYKIEVNWDGEDKVFIARAPEIQGAVIHGDSREEALRNLEAVMIDCLEAEAEAQLQKLDGTAKFLFRMPGTMKQILVKLANERDLSINEMLIDCVKRGILTYKDRPRMEAVYGKGKPGSAMKYASSKGLRAFTKKTVTTKKRA